MTLKKITARKLLAYTNEQLWDILEGQFILVMDDGELATNARSTLFSAFAWRFHRENPTLPLRLNHHIDHILAGKRLGTGTHLKLIGNCAWDLIAHVDQTNAQKSDAFWRSEVARTCYEITDEIANTFMVKIEDCVTFMDIGDFIEILDDPELAQASNTLPATQESIDQIDAILNKVLTSKPQYLNNPISKAARSGLVNKNQLGQCLGWRGFVTDINSDIFKEPIQTNYTKGITKIYDAAIESRSASKSLMFADTPLKQAEYQSRKLQFLVQAVENVHMVDCGSTDYDNWFIKPEAWDRGRKKYGGDLHLMVGKYYLDEKDNQLKVIKASDTHLIGTTVKLRHVQGCQHPDPKGVCAVCYSTLAKSVMPGTNLGMQNGTSFTQVESQLVLSVKHFDGNAVIDGIILTEDERNFIVATADRNSYLLSSALAGKKVKMVISSKELPNVTDINEVDDVEDLGLTAFSSITAIALEVTDGDYVTSVDLDVSIDNRLASPTYQLLSYLKAHQWSINDLGNYVIDLSHWSLDQPILTLPVRHFNMSKLIGLPFGNSGCITSLTAGKP